MRKKKLKIVITNVVSLNGGDAAILKGVVKTIRLAWGDDAGITVLERNAATAGSYYPEFEFEQGYVSIDDSSVSVRALRRLVGTRRALRLRRRFVAWCSRYGFGELFLPAAAKKNLAAMREADLIVSTGGTYLVEHYDFSDKLVQIFLAARARRPVVLFTQSLGPFLTGRNIADVRAALSSAAVIMLRDERSLLHLKEAGIDTNRAHVLADAAFTLVEEKRLAAAASRDRGSPPKIGVSVREWRFPGAHSPVAAARNYHEAVRRAVVELVRSRGASITFLSTCQGIPAYWTDDSRTAEEIVRGLPRDVKARVAVDGSHHRPEELVSLFGDFDLVIATRMHAAILALCGGTPVLPIAYEFKTAELFSRLGFGDWVQGISELSPDSLGRLAVKCLDEAPARHSALIDAVMREHRSACGAARLLTAALDDPSPASASLL